MAQANQQSSRSPAVRFTLCPKDLSFPSARIPTTHFPISLLITLPRSRFGTSRFTTRLHSTSGSRLPIFLLVLASAFNIGLERSTASGMNTIRVYIARWCSWGLKELFLTVSEAKADPTHEFSETR